MAIGTYLQKPTQFQCVQWDGTNSTDVNTALSAVGWSFTVASGTGTAHTPFGGSFTVDVDTWIVVGGGSAQFLSASDFTSGYVAGSSWAVAP